MWHLSSSARWQWDGIWVFLFPLCIIHKLIQCSNDKTNRKPEQFHCVISQIFHWKERKFLVHILLVKYILIVLIALITRKNIYIMLSSKHSISCYIKLMLFAKELWNCWSILLLSSLSRRKNNLCFLNV